MNHVLRIIQYLFLLNSREPVSFYYNLALPLGVFLGILFWQKEGLHSFADALDILYSLTAYTIYTSALYGVGITFADWRESGLFLTFCKSRRALWRILCGQTILRAFASGVYVFVFVVVASLYFHSGWSPLWIRLPILCFLLSICAGFFSFGLLLLKLSPKDLNAIAGVSVFFFLAFNGIGYHGNSQHWIVLMINVFNPIYWNAALLEAIHHPAISTGQFALLGLSALVFLSLGIIGLCRFRPHPILARL